MFCCMQLAHDDNVPHEHSIPWSWSWQPIHEIRDYFGEDCGMYFSWLGHYTSMLFLCMIFGLITGIAQIVKYLLRATYTYERAHTIRQPLVLVLTFASMAGAGMDPSTRIR